jgi:tetratricopeptide (TPR) repeat protein
MWGNTATLHRPGVPVMVVVALLLLATFPSTKAFASPRIARCWTCTHWVPVPLPLRSTNNDDDNNNNPESSSAPPPRPRTFREAEVLGLQWMQEGNYGDALDAFQNGLKLPGSKNDVVRTKMLSGPSPVGGSMGGYESKRSNSLDEFELQAAHYNMACAHAQLGNVNDAIANLQTAFENGFDNYATVRSDPDLEPIQKEKDFETLMAKFEPKKGFNPFGFLGK